jgi:putative colanic acid biosynthesis glycosyltransferase
MNVLQINTVYPNGSTGRIVAEIAAYTAAQPDSRAFVALGIGEPAREGNLTAVRIGSPPERKFHAVIRKMLDAEGYGSIHATRQLIRLCKENHVDVVHLHNLHGCYLNLKRWFRYLAKAGIPVVWTLHDCWPMTGHCAHFTYCGCKKWKTHCGRCPQQHSYPECIGIDGSRRNYRLKKQLFTGVPNLTLIAPCRWTREIVRDSFLRNVPCRVIYNGVDTQRFRPETSDLRLQFGLENKRVLLAAASDWTDRKGLPELIQLSEMLDEPYRLVILGLPEERIKALPFSVLGLKRIDSPDLLRQWYGAADCFVNPTLEDTMPLVNLEALACGTPLAVFNTGGCPEAVTESCGIVVEKGNVPKLRDAVRQICESGTFRPEACIAQAKRFSMEHTLQGYYECYREVSR